MELYRIDKAHVDAAADALADAFIEDGLVLRICADPSARKSAIKPVFRFSAGLAVRNFEAWAVSGKFEGVVLWLESWRMFCPPWTWLSLGGMDIRSGLSREGYRELTSVSERIDRARFSVAPDRYLYLSCLGVRPEFQRRGFATALVRGKVQAAAAEGIPTIVETNTSCARAFYESVGFRVLKTFRAADMDYYVMQYEANPLKLRL